VAIVAGQLAGLYEVRSAKGISLADTPPEYNRWNSFSMVTVLPQVGFTGWGLSPAYGGPVPEQKMLVIDLNAMTTLTRFTGDLREVSHVAFDLVSFVYHVKPHAERVCVIGAGGGKDVLAALVSGAKRVVAVEINPLIVEGVVRGAFRNFVGGLYDRPDVEAVVEDGRSFVQGSKERWDVVHLGMVDTSAATAAGAYALTENGLYTVDAFEQFLRRLSSGGVLSVSSVSMPELAVGARLAAVARAALERLGGDPARSIAVLETAWIHGADSRLFNVLVSPSGFDAATRQRIEQHAARLAFVPSFVPGRPPVPPAFDGALRPERAWIADIINAPPGKLDALLKSLPVDVSATTDNRPFFFYQNRLRDLGRALLADEPEHPFGNGLVILSKVVIITTVMVALFVLVPFLPRRRELIAGQGSPLYDVGYALCLGLGFMFAEIALILRFSVYLGNPTATLSVVLLVLLVMGALGSARLARRADEERLRLVLAAIVAYLLLLAIALGSLLHASHALPGALRSLIAAICLAPLGLLLGVPLPSMLRVVGERAATRIPWLFGINGAASVLGSIVGTLLALHAGIAATLGAAASLYLGALLLGRRVMAS
jgi:spermidine synthase